MKVLIADRLSDKTVADLKKLGAEVVVNTALTEDNLGEALGDVEVLIVRSKKVKAPAIAAAPQLSLIIRAGAGVNTIDLAAASSRGIHVANCPGKNTDAVAELAIGLLIAADRRIVAATNDLSAGKWRKKEYGKATGLKGRTLGILGLGGIGKAVARRAQGLEMKVVAWSRSLTEEAAEELGVGFCASPEALARQSDAVSVHLALKPETKHIINKAFLDQMKNGAILINASRGEVVDTTALKEAIRAKKLRVGLDVFENEPTGGEDTFADTELAA
ncbi:MAG: NAD(P)-dependent oxidoreductase, partial [bacterium]